MNPIIRREEETDFRTVEEITRDAFWNLHCPGCDDLQFPVKKKEFNHSQTEFSIAVRAYRTELLAELKMNLLKP